MQFKNLHICHAVAQSSLMSFDEQKFSFLQGRECSSESDCVFTPHCTTVCDAASKTCSADIVRPNLHLVCQILKEYVLEDSPSQIYPEFVHLVDRCDKLSYINYTRTDVEHSLVLNDLKSLLWKQIDSHPSNGSVSVFAGVCLYVSIFVCIFACVFGCMRACKSDAI